MSLIGEGPLPSTVLVGGMNPVAGGFSGTFFYDHTTLYAYAGMVGEEADGINNSLWSYDTTMNKWSLVEVEGGRISFGNNSEGVHASDPKSGLSFYTGGWAMASNGTNNGTVKFESSNPGTPQWSFMTTQNGIQGPNILKGAMVYVRKGQSGVLIAFGGYNTAYKGDQFASGWDWNQRSLKDVYVYDIFSNTWYLQEASGDIPEHRSDFCAGVSSAPDDSSFQITIHAGWDLFKGIALSDVYTLSIPSFRWIKVVDSDNPDTILEPHAGRQRLKCDVWNERQMIVSGGFVQSEDKHFNDACNESYPPFKVLDTSTYSWRTQFDPRLEYSVPKVVTEVIGGNSTGGAILRSPAAGWPSDDLSSIFSKTVARDTYFYNETTPTASSTPESTGTSASSGDGGGISGGTIAGVVIGILAAILVVAAALHLWTRKRRQAHVQQIRTDTLSKWQKPELEATEVRQQELDTNGMIHELHGEALIPEPVQLEAPHQPSELPG